MPSNIFINLPVKDLNRSIEFFTNLGFSFNPNFIDKNATCLIIDKDSFVMLLAEPFFKTFTNKDIADSTKCTEVLISFSTNSKERVNEILDKALASGATEARETQDLGFMYERSFNDLDGHIWKIIWLDKNAINQKASDPNKKT